VDADLITSSGTVVAGRFAMSTSSVLDAAGRRTSAMPTDANGHVRAASPKSRNRALPAVQHKLESFSAGQQICTCRW
jgi:hypothetical protein